MRVYRVELADGTGPYILQGGYSYDESVYDVCDKISDAHNGDRVNHPAPALDGICDSFDLIAGRLVDYIYGCDSLVSILNWFNGFLRELHDADFTIGVYESDDVRIGRTHCAFIPGEKVTTIPISYALEFFTHMG